MIAARSRIAILAPAMLTACGVSEAQPATGSPDQAHPEVVELFQSQGCSSCPPANANVIPLADRPDVLVLSWQVTYWDYLGWKDSFARPEFTRRQQAYANALGHDSVWTPQVVIDGRGDVVGSDRAELVGALKRFSRGKAGPQIQLAADSVTLSGDARGAMVYLVRYDPRIIQVPIRAGENGGRTLPHRNIVREVSALGTWDGGKRSWALTRSRTPGLKTAILVQRGTAGPILAAAHD